MMFGEIYELVTRWRIGRRNLLAPLRMKRKQRGVRLEMAVGRKTEFRSIRKTKKYTGVGPREFVQYDDEELATEGIKAACEKNFFHRHCNVRVCRVIFWLVSNGHLFTQ